MSTQIDRISELAKEDPKRQFYSIGHMITPEALYAAFRGLRKKASAGVDGVTYEEYQRDAARNIQTLHERLKNGKYQTQPLRRVYIPKENGKQKTENRKQRPLSIPALEDKIVHWLGMGHCRERGALDPKSCYTCWMVRPAGTRHAGSRSVLLR